MMAAAHYEQQVHRLSVASTNKGHQAFVDVAWPDQARLDRDDPRFCLAPHDPLANTAWYRAMPESGRARFGLDRMSQTLKYGISFESILSQGLLEFARAQPNRSANYRYAMHELVEESHHSMMFQEFIDRSGSDPRPFAGIDAFVDRRVPGLGRWFPELFFGLVLAGEIFIDADNRRTLRAPNLHPLCRRVVQIHVTEEARHLCFARRYLEQTLPTLSWLRREAVASIVPLTMAESARKMLQPAPHLAREYGIPAATLRRAFGKGSTHRRQVATIAEPVRRLLADHGLMQPRHVRLWRRVGLLDGIESDDQSQPTRSVANTTSST